MHSPALCTGGELGLGAGGGGAGGDGERRVPGGGDGGGWGPSATLRLAPQTHSLTG